MTAKTEMTLKRWGERARDDGRGRQSFEVIRREVGEMAGGGRWAGKQGEAEMDSHR